MINREIKGIKETIYYDECDNGLKVYMWVKKELNSFYGTLSVKYGSIYNNFKINKKKYSLPVGVPHFLEHIKFNEKKGFTAHDYYNKTGCDTNAFTTFNYTNYQVFGNNNPIDNIIHLLDFVQNDYFTKKTVKDEKGIIIEEANMGIDDPYTVILFNHLDNVFNNYEHKKVITGNKDDIKSITLEDIKLAFNTFYHPQNMFLVVTGNFNPYELMAAIKDNQNKKVFNKYNYPERIIKKEKNEVNKVFEEKNINVTNKKIRIGIKINKKNIKGYNDLELRVLLNILLRANFGSTSDFKDDLIFKEIISNMNYMLEIFDDYIVIMFSIDSDYQDEVIESFNNKFNNLIIDEKTFNRIKNSLIATVILNYEDVEYVNSIIQQEILNYGDIIDNLKERYECITYSEIKDFIKKLDFKEKSILVLNPKE